MGFEDRYEKTPDGKLIIDVSINKYEELYDEWDSSASYVKKDLDADFVDFLREGFEEAPNKQFLLRITVPNRDSVSEEKVSTSVQNYFQYLLDHSKNKRRGHIRMTLIHLFLGLTFMTIYSVLHYTLQEGIFNHLLVEGALVMGWVNMWHTITGLLYEWIPYHKEARICERISKIPIEFRTS